MRSDVEMQDPAPSMLDHKETIQELKTPRGHCKEIHSDDHFAMIGEEDEPASGGIAAAPRMSQIPGHAAFRDPVIVSWPCQTLTAPAAERSKEDTHAITKSNRHRAFIVIGARPPVS